jgi:hypothetical protein
MSQPEGEVEYVARVAQRIVRMFQHYQQNIDPEDERFIGFIAQYLRDRNVRDPKAMKYSKLYGFIKEGIRAYLKEPTVSCGKR